MENVFTQPKSNFSFSWKDLGNIKDSRKDLGEEMPVLVYRLMQYTIKDILCKDFGKEKTDGIFRRAGYLAGIEFAKNVLDLQTDFNTFIAQLQKALQELKMGVLRIEEHDKEAGSLVLTIGQDLDCSGLPVTNEKVCVYDEGLIAGILEAYTGNSYDMQEVDCWASGAVVCRFKADRAKAVTIN